MPFTPKETIGGWRHMIAAWERATLKRPVDYYLWLWRNRQAEGAEKAAFPLKGDDGRVCDICGFALAQVELPRGWMLETCSAVGLGRVLAGKRFADWASRLPSGSGESQECLPSGSS